MSLFPEFYDTGKLGQVAILLWNGWGYNFFKVENQLRADSLLIRSKGSEILGRATRSLKDAESAYREEHLPLPTRAKPLPDEAAVKGAGKIEALVKEVGRIEGLLRSAPAPENDRINQRHRKEKDLLERLVANDKETIGRSEVFRRVVDSKDGQWLIDNESEVREALTALSAGITARADLLNTCERPADAALVGDLKRH